MGLSTYSVHRNSDMKFSYRHGYDPEFVNKSFRDEAPKWIRKLYFSKILERLTYDGVMHNPDKKPLSTYDLINDILAMDDEDPDEYLNRHGFNRHLRVI